jgi:hypothetical protein
MVVRACLISKLARCLVSKESLQEVMGEDCDPAEIDKIIAVSSGSGRVSVFLS